MKIILILIFTFSAFTCYSKTKVAFIKLLDSHGKPREHAVGDQYYHVALHFEGFWYHFMPYHGFVKTRDLTDLKKMLKRPYSKGKANQSQVIEIDFLEAPDDLVLNSLQIFKNKRKHFNILAPWVSVTELNCVQFVAKSLKVKPVLDKQGLYDLSTSELYEALWRRGWTALSDSKKQYVCNDIL